MNNLEVTVYDLKNAILAQEMGVTNIVLWSKDNESLVPLDVVREISDNVDINMKVAILNDHMSDRYFSEVLNYIKELSKLNIYGIIFGTLDSFNNLDIAQLKEVINAKGDLHLTFSSALDRAQCEYTTTAQVNEFPEIDAILTNGGSDYRLENNAYSISKIIEKTDKEVILAGNISYELLDDLLSEVNGVSINLSKYAYEDDDINKKIDFDKLEKYMQIIKKNEFRIEHDSIGEIKVRKDAYYGAQTKRAHINFYTTGRRASLSLIEAIVLIKKAAAKANYNDNELTLDQYEAITQASDEILSGKLLDNFITDTIQGGAGTSFNMNVNEVIANRANEILGGELGVYNFVHPNDHVNRSQSTNDVVPTAIKVALLKELTIFKRELNNLYATYQRRGEEFSTVLKMGRTHLQDAVPISFGQELVAMGNCVKRDIKHLEIIMDELHITNMGATAVGTGVNSSISYSNEVVSYISEYSGFELHNSDNLVDATRNADVFLNVASTLKRVAVNMSKSCNDLRLMASGPVAGFNELSLPMRQPGSSIMPGKVNPVIPETCNQICFRVMGIDTTVTHAIEAGQMELNVFLPVVQTELFEAIKLLKRASITLRTLALDEMQPDIAYMEHVLEQSGGMAIVLSPVLGYEKASKIAKKAVKNHKSVKDILREDNILDEHEIEKLYTVENLIYPHK